MRSKGIASKSKSLKYARNTKRNTDAMLTKLYGESQSFSRLKVTPRQIHEAIGRQKIEAFIMRGIKINKRPILHKPLVASIKQALGVR